MADNTDEEHLDIPANTHSPDPQEEIIPINNAGTITPSKETENMEVHHHPDMHHKPKKWKEYFLEFLMIFLAVTMGFFAETIREQITEHRRAEEFAISMVNDLKADTAEIRHDRYNMAYAVNNVDTLIQLLLDADSKDITSGKLYWYGLWGGVNRSFTPNDATFQQMKSSGSLRYFTNEALALDVAKYDLLCRSDLMHQESDRDIYLEVRKSRSAIFQFKYNKQANDISYLWYYHSPDAAQKIDSFIHSNPPLLSYGKTLFNQYMEMIRSRFHQKFLDEDDSLLAHATRLIADLKKEYHL
jgi:hypothetical protein